jgi:hypothetical protein
MPTDLTPGQRDRLRRRRNSNKTIGGVLLIAMGCAMLVTVLYAMVVVGWR